MKRPKQRKSIVIDHRKKQKIWRLIRQIQSERGRNSAEKVFHILELWQAQGLILGFGESPKWGYDDYICHIDGWFLSWDSETVDFQIVSSVVNAREHLTEHPDIPVIVVEAGMAIEVLSEKMEELFKDKLPQSLGVT